MSDLVLAGGGVVWRKNNEGVIETAIVHRPRYDDWSLPKGKLDSGETLMACAYREIMEETGLQVRLGQFIGQIEYFSVDGQKQVSYWCAEAIEDGSDFKPNSEVDQLLWVDLDLALAKLSRESDIEILGKFISLDFDAKPLIMLRHAKALARKEWQGGDEDRPLEQTGQLQAKRMHSIYQVYGVDKVHTSDAVRCYDTVIGMTKALNIEPKIANQLSEYVFEKNKDKALDYAKDLAEEIADTGKTILLCSHNPILPRMLEKISKKSKVELPEFKLQPGDSWVVFFKKKKVVAIEVVPAPVV